MPPELEDHGQEIFPMGDENDNIDNITPEGGQGASPDQVQPPPEDGNPPPETAKTEEEKWGINWNGQNIEGSWTNPEDRAKLTKWAQMGYDYAQRMQMLKQEKESWEKDPNRQRYLEIDEYVKQNPDWWKHVEESWKSRGIENLAQGEDSDRIKPLLNEVNELKQTISELQGHREQQIAQEEDQLLDQEIIQTREKFPYVDWDKVDESGKSLETRVLEHADQYGIPKFTAAFLDLYQDKLIDRAMEAKKGAQAKERQAEARNGLLGTSPTPTKGLQAASNIKDKSYNALMEEALQEIQQGVS